MFAAVDDEAYARDGEGCLSDVSRDYDFACSWRGWLKNALLRGLRKRGKERKDLEFWDRVIL